MIPVTDIITSVSAINNTKKESKQKIALVIDVSGSTCSIFQSGKTILKNTNTDYKYFSKKEEFENYLDYNYNYIHSYEYIDGTNEKMTRVKVYKPVSDHFNRPQCGVWVLSMSKRIMNEVMCLAEDMGIQIYYQDTE